MSVRHQNGVRRRRRLEFRVYAALGRDAMPPEGGTPRMRLRELTQPIVDTGRVWLNLRTKCDAQKIYAREVRIDEQGVSFEFELVTVGAEISHAHAPTRYSARIVHYELTVMIKSGTKRLSRKYEAEKNAHAPGMTPTTRIGRRYPELPFAFCYN